MRERERKGRESRGVREGDTETVRERESDIDIE